MQRVIEGLPVLSFESAKTLRKWLEENHASSKGMWLRIYKKNSGIQTITFEEVLDEGLCFGWSESKRIQGDEKSYLQYFAPRRTRGTKSQRNRDHIERLIKEKKMTPAGLKVL